MHTTEQPEPKKHELGTPELGKPEKVQRLKKSNQLRLCYKVDQKEQLFCLPAEFLRVHSPSAEVRGHGAPQLQWGKAEVILEKVETLGYYGLKLSFSDGHDTGIYTWEYLARLCLEHESLWEMYLQSLHQAHKSRYPNEQIVQISPAPK